MIFLSNENEIVTVDELTELVREKISSLSYEVACAAFIDAKNNLISLAQLSSGVFYTVDYDAKSLIEYAISISCKRVVLYHNHPSGFTEPSESDIVATKYLLKLLYINGIKLIDHIIVTKNGSQSLFASAPEITL